MITEEPNKFCLRCDYPLSGLMEHRCPECGQRFNPERPRSFKRFPGEIVGVESESEFKDGVLEMFAMEGGSVIEWVRHLYRSVRNRKRSLLKMQRVVLRPVDAETNNPVFCMATFVSTEKLISDDSTISHPRMGEILINWRVRSPGHYVLSVMGYKDKIVSIPDPPPECIVVKLTKVRS